MNKKAFNEGFIKYCAKQGCTDLKTIDRLMRFGEVQLKKEAAYMKKKAGVMDVIASIASMLFGKPPEQLNENEAQQVLSMAEQQGVDLSSLG